jgi:hypothetical protein
MKKMNHKQLEQNRRKLERNKEKAAYLETMKLVANTLGGPGTFSLIPSAVVEVSYNLCYLPVTVTALNHPEFAQRTVTSAHNAVKQLMQHKHFALKVDGKEVLLADFCTAGFTLYQMLCWAITHDNGADTEADFEWVKEFAKRLDAILTEELCSNALTLLYDVANYICSRKNDTEDYFHWFTIREKSKVRGSHTLFVLDVNRRKADTRYFEIDGQRRLTYCVSWATGQHGFIEMKVQLSELGYQNSEPDQTVKIYIQKHALRRLKERIDCLNVDEIHSALFVSFLNPEVVKISRNRILVAFLISNTKVGYLLSEYIDGAVLVHTFLFITNNGTPEGQKLTEFTGLGKLDKKYLAIDKLSSFIKSDIGKNERLRTIFEKAGCSSLLDIEEVLEKISTKHADNSITELLLRYLKTEDELPELDDRYEVALLDYTTG